MDLHEPYPQPNTPPETREHLKRRLGELLVDRGEDKGHLLSDENLAVLGALSVELAEGSLLRKQEVDDAIGSAVYRQEKREGTYTIFMSNARNDEERERLQLEWNGLTPDQQLGKDLVGELQPERAIPGRSGASAAADYIDGRAPEIPPRGGTLQRLGDELPRSAGDMTAMVGDTLGVSPIMRGARWLLGGWHKESKATKLRRAERIAELDKLAKSAANRKSDYESINAEGNRKFRATYRPQAEAILRQRMLGQNPFPDGQIPLRPLSVFSDEYKTILRESNLAYVRQQQGLSSHAGTEYLLTQILEKLEQQGT